MQYRCIGVAFIFFSVALVRAAPIAVPPPGKIYQGFYFGGVGTDSHDPTEHDFSPRDIEQYEKTVGAKTAWIYFSDNWFESRKFPEGTCSSIRQLGKIPFLRLMLRSDVDQNHAENIFTLDKIVAGEFDADLRGWAHSAKDFKTPLLIEWGTEPNGKWFSWNGAWNGGARIGPAKYVAACRHIVDLIRDEGADNVQWVWHVNWFDEPEHEWNAFENYFPGENYCDWVALSIYGPTTPRTRDGTESFAFKLREAYPRLLKLVPDKPIIIAEFGCDLRNKHCNAAEWARGALDEIFSGRWPALLGFCWWNEAWQNDDHKKNDSDMIIWHDPNLVRVFREGAARHFDQIQEVALANNSDGK